VLTKIRDANIDVNAIDDRIGSNRIESRSNNLIAGASKNKLPNEIARDSLPGHVDHQSEINPI